jgi:hypothetical protein
VKFFDAEIAIGADASVTGAVNIDIGGAIEACIRRFWNCRWDWRCSHLTLALRGRPTIKLKLLKSSGVRMKAEVGGDLHFETNLPSPFNIIIKALSSILFKAIMAVINIVLGLLSFYVIYPELSISQQQTKIKLRNFDSEKIDRPDAPGLTPPKRNFIGFTGGLIAEP